MKQGQNFVKYFVHFLGNGVSRKKMLLRFTDLYHDKFIMSLEISFSRKFLANEFLKIVKFKTNW